MRNLISKYNLNTDITATSVLRLPDIIINSNEIDEEVYFKELSECTNKAIETLNKTRAIEGENLKTDILKRLDIILDKVILIEPKSKNLVNEYKEKLNSRLNEIGAKGIIDDSRLGAELVLFADKSSIEEEITRLKSHITTFKQFLNQEDDLPIGKKLDLEDENDFLNLVDPNNSGRVTKDSFIKGVEEMFTIPKDFLQEVEDAFKFFDRNGEGKVSCKELKNLLVKNSKEYTEEEVDELFKTLGLDINGQIHIKQFINEWKFQ